jgi:hypothetical protein
MRLSKMFSSTDTVAVIVHGSLAGRLIERLRVSVARRCYWDCFIQSSVDSSIEMLPFLYGWPGGLARATVIAGVFVCEYRQGKQAQEG